MFLKTTSHGICKFQNSLAKRKKFTSHTFGCTFKTLTLKGIIKVSEYLFMNIKRIFF